MLSFLIALPAAAPGAAEARPNEIALHGEDGTQSVPMARCQKAHDDGYDVLTVCVQLVQGVVALLPHAKKTQLELNHSGVIIHSLLCEHAHIPWDDPTFPAKIEGTMPREHSRSIVVAFP